MSIIDAIQKAQGAMHGFDAAVQEFKVAAKRGDRPACEAARLEAWRYLDLYFNAMAAMVNHGA